MQGDIWNSHVIVTTSRGYGEVLPIAEYVVGAFFHFARGFDKAYSDRAVGKMQHQHYQPVLLTGKTVCVVGTGGIGQAVGQLCANIGMRVIGTRGTPGEADTWPTGFDYLGSPDALLNLLAESDFVAVCCQWTPQTTNIFNQSAFQALKKGAVLVNVARGEIIDEAALIAALAEDRLRGVALDVYVGEFEREPDPRLWHHERVMITPHISSGTDEKRHQAVDIFCENLAAYLAGQPLKNRVDWQLGY